MLTQLQRQLGYLQRSARLFDLGYLDEGIRIATCLRVLFHDRPRDPLTQGSIYKLLGRPSVSLRTTCKPCSLGPNVTVFDGYLHLPGNIRPWNEYLERGTHNLSVEDWWSQVIFVIEGNHVNRRQLTLWAAEKDGGAHADSKLHPGYEALLKMWTSIPSDPTQKDITVVPHQHLLALRRFALEVLTSDELLNVAYPDGQTPDNRIIADWPESWSPVMDRVHEIATVYFSALAKNPNDRDGEAIGRALQLVDDIRLPLSEWHANYLIQSLQYEAARKSCLQIQSIHPGHQHSLYALGYASYRLGLHTEAEKHLLEAVTLNPEHVPSLLALANLYLGRDDFEQARPHYEKILEIDQNHANAQVNLEILKLSERALDPQQAIQALIELGHLYLSINLIDGAKSTFERVLKIDPNHCVAVAALQQGDVHAP